MTITSSLFEAHLKCPTKCWLRFTGETPSGNAYAEWVQTQNESYRVAAAKRLTADECVVAPVAETVKTAKWHLAVDVFARTPETKPRSSRGNEAQTSPPQLPTIDSQPNHQSLLTSAATTVESCLHAVERVPSEGRGKAAQFIPIRFIFRNKLTADDKLLLAFDAFVLSESLGREVSLGKIIHGDEHATLKVKLGARTAESARTSATSKGLVGEVRKRLDKIAALLSSPTPPDLVLNRHCAECEFQARCRKIAVEKDDLSLLAGMSAKERQKLRSKGIFTVTQLSYTFRPRRRPKRQRDKREKYHHALKALAIREKKIHIVGSPELKIEGTPVYLDVEGLPDRDFYYLIGLRIGHGDSAVQHSLWADTVEDEGKIWQEFLAILETVEKPVLIHYGSYETEFLKSMALRYGSPCESSSISTVCNGSVNHVSTIFGRIYFPTFSNRLKEITAWIGFNRSEPDESGLHAVMWRHEWERSPQDSLKRKLAKYNADDCIALELLTQTMLPFWSGLSERQDVTIPVVNVDRMAALNSKRWQAFRSQIRAFEEINLAAQWNYQRDRVYVRSHPYLKRTKRKQRNLRKQPLTSSKALIIPHPAVCPRCGESLLDLRRVKTMPLLDLIWGRNSVRLRWVRYQFRVGRCGGCKREFRGDSRFPLRTKYGWNLVSYFLYHAIQLRIHLASVSASVHRVWGVRISPATRLEIKSRAANFYQETVGQILDRIVRGPLVHVDETTVRVQSQKAYVWVFATLDAVAYVYSETREADVLRATLTNFKGVLISDFYTAYDSMSCPQQKCLIHLIRDLNDEVLKHPFDEELKALVRSFAEVLRPTIATVDRYGLKKYFLHKHRRYVERFYKKLGKADFQSDAALGCKQRLEKNRDKLFTFLDYDGVPWNNNNAEHAIKAVARMRDVLKGSSTACGTRDYLVLLSVCQTCKYMGVDFLDFLRSGEKDIHAFAESRRGRKRTSLG